MSVGPGSRIQLQLTPALSDLILLHNRYQANLPTFDQYIIWRYTIGSGTVNRRLIGLPLSNAAQWVYQFFKYYNFEFYGIKNIPEPFSKWKKYFLQPNSFRKLPDDQKQKVIDEVILSFVTRLEKIILSAPPVPDDIVVYKVSTPYPELPMELPRDQEVLVYQKPFNSTTYDPQLNFAPFLAPGDCCLYQIIIPKGAHVLAVSSALHAYPHEREILLPFASILDITRIGEEELNYIPIEQQPFVKVQRAPYVLGEVYRLDPLSVPNVETRTMHFYNAIVISPRLKE